MQMKEELPLFLDFLKLNGNNVYDEHRNIFPLLVYYWKKSAVLVGFTGLFLI